MGTSHDNDGRFSPLIRVCINHASLAYHTVACVEGASHATGRNVDKHFDVCVVAAGTGALREALCEAVLLSLMGLIVSLCDRTCLRNPASTNQHPISGAAPQGQQSVLVSGVKMCCVVVSSG